MLKDFVDNIKIAIEHGRTDIVRSLLEACDAEDNEPDMTKDQLLNGLMVEDGTFLLYATKLDQADVVRTLLSCGADPGVQNAQGLNAVDAAANQYMRQIYVEELLRATAKSEVGRVCQLIAAGISINSWDSEESKNTPLHWAACYGNKDMVSCLITRGADVNAMNSCGATPLHDAVIEGNEEVVEELLQNGANPLIQPIKGKFAGKTVLDLAAHKPELLELVERYTPLRPAGVGGRARSISVESGGSGREGKGSRAGVMFASQASLDLSPRIDQAIESLLRTHISTPVRPLVTNSSLHLLWPQPQRIVELEGPPFVAQKELHISVVKEHTPVHRILDVWDVCRPALISLGYDAKIGDVQPACGRRTDSQVECAVNGALFSLRDAYQIHVTASRVRMTAASLAGLHYACCTFIQLLRLCREDGSLAPLIIQDSPAMRQRAVLFDISPHGRVPTLDYLFDMISIWSSLKISHLHLYTRLSPGSTWPLCFTKGEMVTIDRYCQDRFVNLVPVLDVDAHVVYEDLRADMWLTFQEILASFPNLSYVHAGPKLCSLLVQQSRAEEGDGGAPRVPLQELWQLLSLSPDVTIMLCSNSLHHLEAGAAARVDVPANVLLVEYGFQADYDFLQWTREFYQQGGMTCLCPGTASWNSLAGCPEASICNIYRAVQAVGERGSLGIIVAHWSGSYHLTPHPFSWPGFVVGAGLAWNPSTHWDYLHSSVPELLDAHVFLDAGAAAGRCVMELGCAETSVLRACRGQGQGDLVDLPPQDGSALYRLLADPDSVGLEHLSLDTFARVTKYIKKCQNNLFRAKLGCKFGEMVIQELHLAADLMLTACRIGRTLIGVGVNPNSNMGLAVINLGVCNLPPTFRTDIANKLLAHIEQYKGTWLQRHLPAGLQNSLLVLTSALHRFVPADSQDT
ncbi:uncharacterized protein LOC134528147 [Bacillus rossius redtenbacheri]|uniref:uncharacterized protein LOC134528147 n=1 Tax=Bacillus rossius redtenbacheri TaxID=93214 RepID=UPI002FDD15FD